MLNLRKLAKNYEDSARSFSELIPWMGLIAPGVVLNKDGSLLAVYEFSGIDAEGLMQHEIDRASSLAEHAMRMFDERFTVWWTLDRRRTFMYPQGTYENPVANMVDQLWQKSFVDSGQYINRQYLAVLYTPPGGIEGFFEKVAHYTKVEEMPLFAAISEAMKSSIFQRAAFKYEATQLESYFIDFQDRMESFTQTVGELNMTRLTDDDLLGYLHRRCSPCTTADAIKTPDVPLYLDSYLCADTLVTRGDTLHFKGEQERHVSAVSIKDWPDFTAPGIIDGLMAMPGELTVSQILRIAENDAARKFIQDVERHNRNMAKSLKTYLVESFTKEESRQVDQGRMALAEDANDAITEMSTAGRIYGYYNLTILTFGETATEAEELAKSCQRLLNQRRYVSIRESMNLLSCFAGTLPGAAGALVRWHFISTANLCDLAPVRSLAIGNPENPYFTEQFQTSTPVPSLTALATEFSTPYYFNFHQGDLAHTLVVGPSRTGKSTFNNFLISQYQKYQPCKTFIFDKDYSCRIPTVLQDGTHVDLAGERGGQVKLNPMALLGNQANWPWLSKWLEIPLAARGHQITAEDEREIWKALEAVAAQPKSMWTLGTLGTFLPKILHEQLQAWIGTGQRARYFDNDEDTFDLGNFTCIEMGGLFDDPVTAQAFIDYAFYRISQSLDGRPALIYIEEAWFMLADDRFSAGINNWLRTLAKKNAWVLMATQSLDEIARSKIFATIIDNIPNRIYLPNSNAHAHEDMYREQFGLNDAQINRIREAIPKMHYYIVTPLLSRMVDVKLPPEILAVVRSDSRAQKTFDKHFERGTPEWKYDYIEEMAYGEERKEAA